MNDNLLNRLRQLSAPVPAADHPAPKAGQLWRAHWRTASDERACLVILMAESTHGEREVDVVPATINDAGDDRSVLVGTTDGFNVTAWTALRKAIYKFALSHRIGDLDEVSDRRLHAVAREDEAGDWPPILDVLDDRVLERADLKDRVEFLAAADWAASENGAGRSMEELVAAAGVSNSDIATALHIAPGDAQRLRQGRRPVRPDELPALTELLGETPRSTIYLDANMLAELDEPELRPLLDERAESQHGGDGVALRRHVAERVMAMQFRQQEHGEPNWKQAIRDALAED